MKPEFTCAGALGGTNLDYFLAHEELTIIWLWASVILPGLFGVFFLIAAPTILEQTPAVAVAHQVGIRQLVYAGVLAFAILKLPKRVAWVLSRELASAPAPA